MIDLMFRAYHKPTGQIYFFDLMWGNFKSGGGYIGMSPDKLDWDNRTFVDPTDCEIMQFTGLLDRNGKDIYEGDVVKYNIEHIGEVKYIDRYTAFRAVFKNDTWTYLYENIEVIGNIYEKNTLHENNS